MLDKKPGLFDKTGESYTTQLNKTNTFLMNVLLALYHKSFLPDNGDQFKEKISLTLDEFAPSRLHGEGSVGRVNNLLIDLIEDVINLSSKTPISTEWLSIKLEPLSVDHGNVIHAIIKIADEVSKLPVEKIEERFRFYTGLIFSYQKGFLLKKKAREAFSRTLGANEEQISKVLKDVMLELEPMLVVKELDTSMEIAGVNEIVSTGDTEAIKDKFRLAEAVLDPKSVMLTALQGVNTSLSTQGGLLRGQFIEIQAPSGGAKSDTTRYIMRGVALHNDPYLFDQRKKAALVYISLEDQIDHSIDSMVTQLRREEGDCYDLEPWTIEQKTEYFHTRMEARGFKIFLIKADQKVLTSSGIIEIFEYIKQAGYEIALAAVDYMGQLDYSDINEPNESETIKTSYARVFTYTTTNRITFIALSQVAGADYRKLNDEANDVDAAATLVDANLSSFCKNIINVIDTRVLIKIEKGNSGAYYQWAVGKNRKGTQLRPDERYCVYRMHSCLDKLGIRRPSGFILSDLGGRSMALKNTPDITLSTDDLSIGNSLSF